MMIQELNQFPHEFYPSFIELRKMCQIKPQWKYKKEKCGTRNGGKIAEDEGVTSDRRRRGGWPSTPRRRQGRR